MPLIRKPAPPVPHPAAADAAEILGRMRHASTEERWAAARASAALPQLAAALAAALPGEPDPGVREAMFTSLMRIGSAESIDSIVSMLRSDEAALRTGALDALHASGAALPALLPRLLTDADADVRILSCGLARELPQEDATHQLCALLDGEQDINVCSAAIEVLAEVGSHDAIAVMVRCGQRFSDAPFLVFAVDEAARRIRSQDPLRP